MNRTQRRNSEPQILKDIFDAYHILKTYAESVNDTIILKNIKKWESYKVITLRGHSKSEIKKDYPAIIEYYREVIKDVDAFVNENEGNENEK